MPKLQQIERSNGSIVSSVNLPLEVIEASGWEKGDELNIKAEPIGKDRVFRIVITRIKDKG